MNDFPTPSSRSELAACMSDIHPSEARDLRLDGDTPALTGTRRACRRHGWDSTPSRKLAFPVDTLALAPVGSGDHPPPSRVVLGTATEFAPSENCPSFKDVKTQIQRGVSAYFRVRGYRLKMMKLTVLGISDVIPYVKH
jgi:hypothetical protein